MNFVRYMMNLLNKMNFFKTLFARILVKDNIFARNIRQLIEERTMVIQLTSPNLDYMIIRNQVFSRISNQTGISVSEIQLICYGKIIPKYAERFLLSHYFNLPERLVRTNKFYDNSFAPTLETLREKSKAH